nr:hypothetical protein [Tanacetum cinerariifolium]
MLHLILTPIVPDDPLVALEVGAVSVTSPIGVLDLVDYSSSNYDPSKDSLPPAPELPLVSPFLCFDDSKADTESEPAEQRPKRHESLVVHDVMVSRWREKDTSRPSSPSRSSSHDTFAPSSEPRKLLTARKRVGPFPARRLAWRRVSHRSSDRYSSPDFTSSSSSSSSSLDSSSDTSLSSPLDSLLDTSCVMQQRSAPLSTPYPLTTSESSPDSSSKRSLDSSSLSAGPSRKRYRSPTTSVSLSTPVLRSIAPTHADLLPPRKRFRDSYSPEDSRDEHIEIGAEAVVDFSIGDGVGAHNEDGIGMRVEKS